MRRSHATRLDQLVADWLVAHPGATMRDAQAALGVSLSTVHLAVKRAGLRRIVVWRYPDSQ